MDPRLSSRGDVPPFYAMELTKLANERRAQGVDVISLCLGQPSTGAPAAVRAAAIAALESGDPLGTPTPMAWSPCARQSRNITRGRTLLRWTQ